MTNSNSNNSSSSNDSILEAEAPAPWEEDSFDDDPQALLPGVAAAAESCCWRRFKRCCWSVCCWLWSALDCLELLALLWACLALLMLRLSLATLSLLCRAAPLALAMCLFLLGLQQLRPHHLQRFSRLTPSHQPKRMPMVVPVPAEMETKAPPLLPLWHPCSPCAVPTSSFALPTLW
jgi:hypothetical protein